MRDGRRDRGHRLRKAGWLTVALLLFVPHVIFTATTKADEVVLRLGERLYVWSHPCLYRERS